MLTYRNFRIASQRQNQFKNIFPTIQRPNENVTNKAHSVFAVRLSASSRTSHNGSHTVIPQYVVQYRKAHVVYHGEDHGGISQTSEIHQPCE